MKMGMRMCVGHSQELKQSQHLEYRLVLEKQLSLRLELIQTLRDDYYEPAGICPDCGRALSLAEIVTGFNDDPHDFTTRCTNCGTRFNPKLINRRNSSSVEVAFLCSCQTLEQLRVLGLESTEPIKILKDHPGVYRSAIFHFGNLKLAFKQIGVEYTYTDLIGDVSEKIKPFLGFMPDAEIAKYSGLPVKKVGKLRRELGLSPYKARREY